MPTSHVGPSFCWECGRKLTKNADRKYQYWLKPIGEYNVRVHKECLDDDRAEDKRDERLTSRPE